MRRRGSPGNRRVRHPALRGAPDTRTLNTDIRPSKTPARPPIKAALVGSTAKQVTCCKCRDFPAWELPGRPGVHLRVVARSPVAATRPDGKRLPWNCWKILHRLHRRPRANRRAALIEMTRLAGSAIARATTALLDADVTLADTVIAADHDIDRLRGTSAFSRSTSPARTRWPPTCARSSRRCE